MGYCGFRNRLATGLIGAFSIEGEYRKQWGLQRNNPDNNYRQFALTRTFSRRIRQQQFRQ